MRTRRPRTLEPHHLLTKNSLFLHQCKRGAWHQTMIGKSFSTKMAPEGNEKETGVTQVSFGGFSNNVTAKMLSDFLEEEVLVLVWRCRLKTSWTPLDSYPDFEVQQMDAIQRISDYEKVEPHAFVHLDSPSSVSWVLDAVAHCSLILGNNPLRVSLGPENPFWVNKRRRTTVPFKLSDVCLDVGTLTSREHFLVGWSGPTKGVDFLVDPFDGTCKFLFTRDTAFAFKGQNKHAVIKCDYKVEFLVRELNAVKQYKDDYSSLVVLIQLACSPLIFYRTADDDIYIPTPFDQLDDDDPWIRTTDFTCSGAMGRCGSYRIAIPPRNGPHLEKALKYLKERRVPYERYAHWLRVDKEPNFGDPMLDTFFCVQHEDGLSFDVKFMLNAVLHKGIMNQYQLSDKLFKILRAQPEEVNIAALQHICSYKHPVYDAATRLKLVQDWLLKTPKMLKVPKTLDDFVQIRRLVVTPTKAYCLPPEVELSNRVVRHYKDAADRFLRVTFMDEGMQMLNSSVLSFYAAPIVKEITSNSYVQRTTVFRRIDSILKQGFYLCGRKYSFLAFSSNQLRDRSAWFFAEDSTDKNLTAMSIRNWMGKFDNRNVAKCAARMGQCFSSTYATIQVPRLEVNFNFPDIERNGYVFSDGIGMITPDLALKVAKRLQLKENPPCAYQIRYAGCKGVVTCWPEKDKDIRLYLRPSMIKFQSSHSVLEVCSWTRFQPGFLNRQIVTLLSSLNVPDETFWRMQETMIAKLNDMFLNAEAAFYVLTESCAEQGNTAAIMLSSGFKPQTEPYLRGMLTCIRASQLNDLREKARIFVPKGRWLMGCLDELGVLEQGQCFIQVSIPSLEDTFRKHGSMFSETKKKLSVIEGLVIIAKNPCLHPGDIRILEAVDAPGLHHLFDCVVFPQNGERPHTNEASGSDLDGDLYFVAWDEDLIPPSKRSWLPMEYAAVEAKKLKRDVNTSDIIDFFTRNMVTENLGAICNAHVVLSDTSECGALDENCIQLARLAATAVDFPKTGKLVTMPYELKPKMYPDFMGKPDFQSYKSKKILGRMYRRIKDTWDEDDSATSIPTFGPEVPFDDDLEIPGSESFLNEAWDLKCSYEGQLTGLLGQYKVSREEEVVTGHVWSMPRYSSRKQGDIKEKLKHAYSALKKEFRLHFDKLGSDYDQFSQEEKNVVYEKKASAWYVVTYDPEWVKRSIKMRGPEADREMVILSFAWIPADYLARIKIRRGGKGSDSTDSSKPINSLAKFLALRI